MTHASRVAESTTATNTATMTLTGAQADRCTVASLHTVGETGIELVVQDVAGHWLEGAYTLTSVGPTVMTRTAIYNGSNGFGVDVTFPAGSKSVFEDLLPASINDFARISEGVTAAGLPAAGALSGSDIVAISQAGTDVKITLAALVAYVASTLPTAASAVTLTGPASGTTGVASTNFTVGANGVISGTVIVAPSDGGAGGTFTPTTRSISSGAPTGTFTYTPASSGAKTISVTNNGSLTNPANITYTASASAATAITMSGPTGGVVSVASANLTAAANGALTGTVVVTPSDAGGGGTFTPTTVSISSGTPSATFTYTPSATPGARTISVTNNGGLTNPANITYTSTSAATVPATMAAPVATGGDATASVVMVAPSNGGSAITGYTVTSIPAGGVDSNAGTTGLTHTMTGLTNGTAYTFTAKATNAVGTAATASPASNSVTPAAVVTYTITGYSSNAVVATLARANATSTYTGLKGFDWTKQFTLNRYWNSSPVPASMKSGWGTSSTVPPAEISAGQNANGASSINGMCQMALAASPAWDTNDEILWVPDTGATGPWFYWIKPVDGVSQCMNPSAGVTIT